MLFTPVEDTEVRVADRQLVVGARLMIEHETMAGTIHGLERKLLLLHFEAEHVLGVVGPVARLLPQLRVIHVRGDHFAEAALSVLLPNQLNEFVVEVRSLRVPER
jgi:hypothetical protein